MLTPISETELFKGLFLILARHRNIPHLADVEYVAERQGTGIALMFAGLGIPSCSQLLEGNEYIHYDPTKMVMQSVIQAKAWSSQNSSTVHEIRGMGEINRAIDDLMMKRYGPWAIRFIYDSKHKDGGVATCLVDTRLDEPERTNRAVLDVFECESRNNLYFTLS